MTPIEKWKRVRKLRKCDIPEVMERIKERTEKAQPGTEEFERLRHEMEQELRNKKLVKEMKFMGFPLDKAIMIAVILVIAGFGFALDLESPKALKIAQFVLKLPFCKV